MGFFRRDPEAEYRHKLERFRTSFIQLIEDGTYPPQRQERLYKACTNIGLNWDDARAYVLPHALNFFSYIVSQVVADGHISAHEIAQLQRLQRRLGIPEGHAKPLYDLYDLIERKITQLIADRAAYLSAAPAVADIKAQIAAYGLPDYIADRITAQLDEQHELAKLMAGMFPVVPAPVALYRDEQCHFHQAARFVPTHKQAPETLSGMLIVTSERLLFLSTGGGFAAKWSELAFTPNFDYSLIAINTAHQRGVLHCPDISFQWLSTLISAACRHYGSALQATKPNKRLISA